MPGDHYSISNQPSNPVNHPPPHHSVFSQSPNPVNPSPSLRLSNPLNPSDPFPIMQNIKISLPHLKLSRASICSPTPTSPTSSQVNQLTRLSPTGVVSFPRTHHVLLGSRTCTSCYGDTLSSAQHYVTLTESSGPSWNINFLRLAPVTRSQSILYLLPPPF